MPWASGNERGLVINGWKLHTKKAPILTATESDEASADLGLTLPEICFGNNILSLQHVNSSFVLSFNCKDALALVDCTGDEPGGVRVSYADEWRSSTQALQSDVVGTIDNKRWDWTYSTNYAGTCSVDFVPAPPSHPGIPLSKLASTTDTILFYDDVSLFEDELHDNGISSLSVRVRVMPHSVFMLMRFFLRVDRVLFRVHDVRIYHSFDSYEVIRECKGKEVSYQELLKQLPKDRQDDLTLLTNTDWVARAMGMLDQDSFSQNISSEKSNGSWKGLGSKLELAKLPC